MICLNVWLTECDVKFKTEWTEYTHTHTRKVLRRCDKEQKGTKTINTQEGIRAERTHLRNMAERNLSDETGSRNDHNAHKTRDYQNKTRNITSSEKETQTWHTHKCEGNRVPEHKPWLKENKRLNWDDQQRTDNLRDRPQRKQGGDMIGTREEEN